MLLIDLPERPSVAQVLYAALCAENESDRLLVEALKWRETAHDLHNRVDIMKERM